MSNKDVKAERSKIKDIKQGVTPQTEKSIGNGKKKPKEKNWCVTVTLFDKWTFKRYFEKEIDARTIYDREIRMGKHVTITKVKG